MWKEMNNAESILSARDSGRQCRLASSRAFIQNEWVPSSTALHRRPPVGKLLEKQENRQEMGMTSYAAIRFL